MSDARRDAPALLISLPHGLNVSGVAAWAVRLANARAAAGRPTGLFLHPAPGAQRSLVVRLHPGVRRFDLPASLPRLDDPDADSTLDAILPAYASAVREMAQGRRVVLSPNLHARSYALAARVLGGEADRASAVAWLHSDNDYDVDVASRYEVMLARVIGVSERLRQRFALACPRRASDARLIHYGVPVAPSPRPARPDPRAIRLLYAGRLEHRQKRVLALVEMSDALERAGVAHRLTIMGDGPGSREVDDAAASRADRIRRLPPGPPDEVDDAIDRADAVVLGSRYEGLSVSMLEAMARARPVIATRVESGLDEAFVDGESGVVAEALPDVDERAAGEALALGVRRALDLGFARLGQAAWERARERFSIEAHAERVERVLLEAADDRPRYWPASRPADASSSGGSPEGALARERMARVLDQLEGERIVIHGCGSHTRALGDVLASTRAVIVAFADDDRARHGERIWNWPIIAPERASEMGARHVVISSRIHEHAVLARRGVYESRGLIVHALYATNS